MSPRLERFLFAEADPRMVRLFRILLAAMLAFAFWPRPSVVRTGSLVPLYEAFLLTPGYWASCLALLLLLAAGPSPRLAGLLTILALLPLAFLSRGERSRQVLLATTGLVSLYPREGGPLWPMRLVQLQLAVLYAANAIAKTTPHYLSGDALRGMGAHLPNFLLRFDDGRFRLGPVDLPLPAAAALSVLAEYALAAGIFWRRGRVLVAAAGVAFHLILTRVVRIFLLDATAVFLYLSFLLPFGRRPQPTGEGP